MLRESIACVLGLAALAGPARADGVASSTVTSSTVAADPRARQIRALIAGTLDPSIDAEALFDVALDDEIAVSVERARLDAIIGSVGPPRPLIGDGDLRRWTARVDLDRARLELYARPPAERGTILAAHAARQEASRPREPDEVRRAREAKKERAAALEAARVARSELERRVGLERNRLVTIEDEIVAARARFAELRTALLADRDVALGWRARAREATGKPPEEVDSTYDGIRATLRESRDAMDEAIDAIGSTRSELPELGPDPVAEIADDRVRARRAEIELAMRTARADERALHDERAKAGLEEIQSLNRDRLTMLPYLTPAKRAAVTGFTAAGLDQARAEARHLFLVLRYHRMVAARWLRTIGEGGARPSAWAVSRVLLPWLVVVATFVWWRRRSSTWVAILEERLAERDRAERRSSPSAALRAARLLSGVHRSLEWLLFFGVSLWLLPDFAQGLLEVQLLTVIVGWTIGGAVAVNALNGLAAAADSLLVRTHADIRALRLRSLRLVGSLAVGLGLVLVVSARLVGEGTVYSWVVTLCWLMAPVVILVLVRWWRAPIFERVARIRRKSRLQAWVLAHTTGWASAPAALIAAAQMLAQGAVKLVQRRLVAFTLFRKAHAYLFKRELDRLAESKPGAPLVAVREGVRAALAPDRAATSWLECPTDLHLTAIRTRIRARKGGVIALIGARGAGKTEALRRLAGEIDGAILLPSGERVLEIDAAGPLVLLDDAHAMIKPVLGGLASFDQALSSIRSRSGETLWVLALDAVLWPLLRRARDAQPLFDEILVLEPWTDDQIGALLGQRTEAAGVRPTFEDLLEPLPASADEIDRQDALAAKRAGYHRMIWDYAGGNPAIALQAWRDSLAEGTGDVVRVRPLQSPSGERLESLPDSTLFIMRAVLQLSPASVADLADATRLTAAEVDDAVRFGQGQGYFAVAEGRVRVTWPWLRAVTVFLERRHLLVPA